MFASKWRVAALLVLIAVAFSARSLVSSRRHIMPIHDEPSYLDAARQFSEIGGASRVVKGYLSGTVLEDKWQPLYLLMLAPFMDNSPLDFPRAKILSLLSILMLMAVVFWLVRQLWGTPVALLTAAFLGFSPAAMLLSHRVLADILFSLFYFSAIYAFLRLELSWKAAVFIGFLIGCAYLSKGNGQFLLLSILAAGVLRKGRSFFKTTYPYLCLAAFMGTAGFLLIRNIRVWGRPFYHLASRVFWLDSWQEYFVLMDLPIWSDIGLRWYLSHHTPLDMIVRLWKGCSEMVSMLVYALAVGPAHRLTILASGVAMLATVGYGCIVFIRQKKRVELAAIGTTSLVLFLAFSWGIAGMNSHWRYMFPVAVTLFPFAALMIWNLIKKNSRAIMAIEVFIAASCMLVLIQNRSAFSAPPLSLWSAPTFVEDTSHWIKENIPDEKYLIDYRSRFSAWMYCRDNRDPYPFDAPLHFIEAHLKMKQVRYIVYDQWAGYPAALAHEFEMQDAHGPLTFLGRKRCFSDAQTPSALLIYGDVCPASNG